MLVTGNCTLNAMDTNTAEIDSSTVVPSAHSTEASTTLPPFLSFPNDAVPDANVSTMTGTAMHIPRLIMKDESALVTESAEGLSPKRSAVANPMRSAAMYVTHVFIGISLQHRFRPVNYRVGQIEAYLAYIRFLILSPTWF